VTEQFGVESFAASSRWHEAHGPVPAATEGSVGIIGGGPAGLVAGYELRLAGHPVTVYEAQVQLGGMMTLGIPEYRLPRALIEREIDAILELGIEVRTGFEVGVETSVADLLGRHEALFLAIGTGRGRDLDLPGRELDGVLRAVEYLLNVNRGFRIDLGERVVVVGGGSVAFDAARTALRAAADDAAPSAQPTSPPSRDDARRAMTTTLDAARAAVRAGVREVTVVALESPTELPAEPDEIAAAEAEGVTIRYRRGPHAFVGEDRIRGLETIDVESVFDEQGRFAPTFRPGTEDVVPADTVILAVGQVADLRLLDGLGLDVTPQGTLRVDPLTLRTSHTSIWAGGDVAHGPRNLIDAVADGQRAARAIHEALSSAPSSRSVGDQPRMEIRRRTGFRRLDSGYDAIPRVDVPTVPTSRRVGFAEVETGYDVRQAQREALRCLRCFDNVMLDPGLCILCGLCVDVCPTDCIRIVRADRLGLGTARQSTLLLDEDRCIRCALCVNRCPPGALSMVHAREVAGG
jgi:NADPH-dependent glutamate synthase beta subunit-like oxidoreductase